MKKVLAVLASAAVAVAMIGCASNDGAARSAGNDVPVINNPDPTGEIVLLDGFEEGMFWQAVGDSWDQWGSHNLSLDIDTTTDWATEGETAGVFEFDIAGPDTSCQATFPCYSLEDTDITIYKEVVMDINNVSDTPLQVNFAIQDNQEWQWSKTETFTIGKGVNKNVTFSLVNNITDGSDKPIDALIHGDSVACIMFQVVGENEGGQVYIDNVRYVKK